MTRPWPSILLGLACLSAGALAPAETKETGADLGAQAAADAIKSAASADGAFIAAGMLKDGYDKTQDLASMLLYPEDQIMVVKLTGAQVHDALERSVSLYPQPNTSFLQLSGFEATFNKNASDGKRITSVTAGGVPLNNSSTYTVAMPARLAQGGYGFFKIWGLTDIQKTLENATVESVLKGKAYTDSSPRWTVVATAVAGH
ncbi:MAG TPA: 5'-nucleotidase [Fimbriimonadaceae bacterium]|nr:5'-nucleotidase [Fimbriimonadaceae bacterium]